MWIRFSSKYNAKPRFKPTPNCSMTWTYLALIQDWDRMSEFTDISKTLALATRTTWVCPQPYSHVFCFLHAYYACFVSSCMAKPIFMGKSEVLHLCEGPELRTHNWWDREGKKKTQQLEGFKPTTLRVLLRRRVFYLCTTQSCCISLKISSLWQNASVLRKIFKRARKNSLTSVKQSSTLDSVDFVTLAPCEEKSETLVVVVFSF